MGPNDYLGGTPYQATWEYQNSSITVVDKGSEPKMLQVSWYEVTSTFKIARFQPVRRQKFRSRKPVFERLQRDNRFRGSNPDAERMRNAFGIGNSRKVGLTALKMFFYMVQLFD